MGDTKIVIEKVAADALTRHTGLPGFHTGVQTDHLNDAHGESGRPGRTGGSDHHP